MKWFGNKTISPYPGERARQFVEYLSRSGDLPERDSIAAALFDTIRESLGEIEEDTLGAIYKLGYPRVSHWIAMFAPEETIDILLKQKLEQTEVANLIQNDNITDAQLEALEALTDTSNRGIMNVRAIHDKKR